MVWVCAYRIGGDEVGRFNRAARISYRVDKGTALGEGGSEQKRDVSRQEADDEGNLESPSVLFWVCLAGRSSSYELIRAGISVPNSPRRR